MRRFALNTIPPVRHAAPQRWLAALLAAGALSACGGDPAPAPEAPASQAPTFTGTAVCAGCHAAQARLWQGSDHDLAMQKAGPATVLGDFSGTSFDHNGVRSRFETRDGRYFVTTDGPDGQPGRYPVLYTFGVRPLQQYLAQLPGGRIQALPVAWDTRPAADGGQRWFHVYGDEPIGADDPLHWTRLSQNWETQCADCHSTGLVKQYDPRRDHFDTHFADLDVGCEACHGPGSAHVAWARNPAARPDPGLPVSLHERDGVQWQLDPASGNSHRSRPRTTRVEINTCAACHARRAQIGLNRFDGELLNAYLPALITPPLYYPDGQVRDEDYVYGSFMQSRMQQQGVTCSDCHEPHSLGLRAPGPTVCLRCHAAARYATVAHQLHEPGSPGASCIECHMPVATFMQIDRRRDHSFRIPRPGLSARFGTPLACLSCHGDRDAAWASGVLTAAGRNPASRPAHWSERLAAIGEAPAPGLADLAALASDATVPVIVRASALVQVRAGDDPAAARLIARALQSPEPLIRFAAARALQTASAAHIADLAPALLDDPVKAVRLAAVSNLAPLGADVIPAGKQARYRDVIREYLQTQQMNAERAEAQVNIGNLHWQLGRPELAEAAYRTALKVNRYFVPAYVNLADLYRARQQEADAEQLLRDGLKLLGDQPVLHHALGLSLVRQKRLDEALGELRLAAEAADATPRFALAYGLALDAAGQTQAARDSLEAARARFGDDPGLLAALARVYNNAGDEAAARALLKKSGT